MSFVTIDSDAKLDQLFEKSFEQPILLFKHSITCPISTDASTQMSIVDHDVNLIIVQTHRHLSNNVETRTGIRHESPQVIIIKDGKPIFQTSHYSITADKINSLL